MPANLERSQGHKTLQPGDAFTFVSRTQAEMRHAHEVGVGNIIRYYFEGENRARRFKLTAIHDKLAALESEYVDQEEQEVPNGEESNLSDGL